MTPRLTNLYHRPDNSYIIRIANKTFGEVYRSMNRHVARSHVRRALLSLSLFALLSIPAFSQTLGEITGRVTDASSAGVPGATITSNQPGHQRGPHYRFHRRGRLHVPFCAAGILRRESGTSGLQVRRQQQCRSAGAADRSSGYGAPGGPGERIGRGFRAGGSAAGRKRLGRNRYREQGRNRTAAEWTRVPQPGRACGQRQYAFAVLRPGRLARRRRPRFAVHLGRRTAHHVRLLHARWREQYGPELPHLHRASVDRRDSGVQSPDRHLSRPSLATRRRRSTC